MQYLVEKYDTRHKISVSGFEEHVAVHGELPTSLDAQLRVPKPALLPRVVPKRVLINVLEVDIPLGESGHIPQPVGQRDRTVEEVLAETEHIGSTEYTLCTVLVGQAGNVVRISKKDLSIA